tara:strand:- start:429 stop:611 length:183 start_codon:yes stop_codon:yes gene_type:complete
MYLYGFNRRGFLYIANEDNLISQQTTSDVANMCDKYCSIPEFENWFEASKAFNNRHALSA